MGVQTPKVDPLMNTDRFRIRPGKRLSLVKHDPDDSKPFRDRSETEQQGSFDDSKHVLCPDGSWRAIMPRFFVAVSTAQYSESFTDPRSKPP